LDEADEKDSRRETDQEQVSYPDIKTQMHRLYESKDAGSKQSPFGNSKKSMPRMGLNHSIEQRAKGDSQRRHLNSNDTELAHHTRNLNASRDSEPNSMEHLHLPH